MCCSNIVCSLKQCKRYKSREPCPDCERAKAGEPRLSNALCHERQRFHHDRPLAASQLGSLAGWCVLSKRLRRVVYFFGIPTRSASISAQLRDPRMQGHDNSCLYVYAQSALMAQDERRTRRHEGQPRKLKEGDVRPRVVTGGHTSASQALLH